MRKKKGGRHGPSRGPLGPAAPGGHRGPSNASAQAMDSFLAAAMGHSAFSMRDEARNTTRDHLNWDKDEKLRYRPVNFISAGLIEPLKEMQPEPPSQRTAAPPAASSVPQESSSFEACPAQRDTEPAQPPAPAGAAPAVDDLFVIDTLGDQSLRDPHSLPLRTDGADRGRSGDETDSSEEVILFKGRTASRRTAPPAATISVDEMRREIELVANAQAQRLQARSITEERPDHQTIASAPGSSAVANRESKTAVAAGNPISHPDRPADSDQEDALADYIDNMDGLEDLIAQHQGFAARDLGGSDDDMVVRQESGSDDSINMDDPALAVGSAGSTSGHSESEEDPPPMDDEHLARLLAKQEALGYGGDDLVLFDDAAGWSIPGGRRHKAPHPRHKASKIPDSAAAVADAFDDNDLLMDWDRANPPRKQPKGRYALSFDVADAELSAVMESSFEKDRLKKKERKREREELRAKGLLGKQSNPDDPRVKYVDGINLQELQQEFTTFLVNADQILTLPPMDASARKIVHEVAIKLKIKSKSTGKGDQRRPVLHRTKSTALYNEDVMETIFSRVHRRFFPRLDKRKSGPGGGTARSGYAALRYRDGEVVGGSAPELGETNKGRAMLEKMGWSKGTGLGALDNKGILEPVAHVVKVSKAGLG